MSAAAPICILGAARTPIGSLLGDLSPVTAQKLGARAIAGALDRAGIAPEGVSEVMMGNVLSAGLGQAPARQASLAAGIPDSAPCTTLAMICKVSFRSSEALIASPISRRIDRCSTCRRSSTFWRWSAS